MTLLSLSRPSVSTPIVQPIGSELKFIDKGEVSRGEVNCAMLMELSAWTTVALAEKRSNQ